MKNTKFALILFLLPFLLTAQQRELPAYEEEMDDPYLAPNPVKRVSPPYRVSAANITTIQVNTDENGDNILGDAANEPSIAIDPSNPNRMVIGWRQFDNVTSNFRQAGAAYTLDGGASWTNIPPLEAGVFRSDPVLSADSYGNFYYNSLTNQSGFYECDVFKTANPNQWGEHVNALGGDKQWMVIDTTSNSSNGHIYSSWTWGTSNFGTDNTRSIDGGESYPATDDDIGNQWGTLSVGPNGKLYSCGVGKFAYSSTARFAELPMSWDDSYFLNLGGNTVAFMGPNPAGLSGQNWVATDHSSPERAGNVYVLSALEPAANTDPCDVFFIRSRDEGITWSDPIIINDDADQNHWQWMAVMSVAPNGRIDAAWLDTRDDPNDGYISSLYYAYSLDEGESWSENTRLSESFDPHVGWPNQEKMGDYFHLISDNDGAHLAWAGTINGEQDVYYSFIQPEMVISSITNHFDGPEVGLTVFPNPVRENLGMNLELPATGRYKISLQSIDGRQQIAIADQRFPAGQLRLEQKIDQLRISPGIYLLSIADLRGKVVVKKVVIE